jgi:hypothetical protein
MKYGRSLKSSESSYIDFIGYVIRSWLLTTELLIQSRIISCEIHCNTDASSLLIIIPPLLHAYLYHLRFVVAHIRQHIITHHRCLSFGSYFNITIVCLESKYVSDCLESKYVSEMRVNMSVK